MIGFAPIPVLLGAVLAFLCLWLFSSVPKVKGIQHQRLLAEQSYLQQGYEFQLKLNLYSQDLLNYQSYQRRLQSLLEKVLQNSDLYSAQIGLYRRAIKCTEDYLMLCDLAVEKYKSAIDTVSIQVETSKLTDDLAFKFTDVGTLLELDCLEDQMLNSVPPKIDCE